ncbi:hypothetical protein OQA88_2527 [Cercophora sp. LCS_1]
MSSPPPTSDGSGSSGLSTSDIVGLAVGIPSGVLALLGAIISFCAWKYPATPIGKLGSAIRHQLSVRGGDARGGDAHGEGAHGGDAEGGSAHLGTGSDVPDTTNGVGEKNREQDQQPQLGMEVLGGDARGGDAYGQNVHGGAAHGGSAVAAQRSIP